MQVLYTVCVLMTMFEYYILQLLRCGVATVLSETNCLPLSQAVALANRK